MRIAQVTQNFLPMGGGQEVYIQNLNRVLRAGGHTVEIFQPNRRVREPGVFLLPRFGFISRFVHGAEPYIFNFFLNLLHRRRFAEAEVIIAHYAFHAPPFRRFAEKTIVLSHGVEWHLENQTWDDRIHQRRAHWCLNRFPHVVNDTHYLRHFGHAVEPATGFFTEVAPGKWFIPNCVDTGRFRATDGIPELKARNVILVPRQIVPDRGIDLAIRAFKHFHEKHPDIQMLIVGKRHRGAYYHLCEDLIRKYELQKVVQLQDLIPHPEIPAYYSSALLTVIPTLRREGTSLSALESMACGTPTVSTNVAGLRDLPTLQCDPEEVALASAMEDAFKRRTELAASQSATVRTTFNLENWAAAWMQTIEQVARR
jgi:glycosyltransferase involved in cell wall biosynthesis